MINILSWILHTLFTISFAYLCVSLFGTGRKSLDLALAIFFWVFVTTLSLLLLGLAGELTPLALGLLSSVGLVSLAYLPVTRQRVAGIPASCRRLLQASSAWIMGLEKWLRVFTLIFVVYMVLRTVFLIWALPPFIWDSLAYHLTNVAQWIQDARIHVFTTPVERIYNAANHEVFTTWFAVFLHLDVVIEAAGLPAYFIAGLAVYAIGRSLALSRDSSWLAALAYLSTPALTLAVTGTKNDPVLAGLYLLMIALILHITLEQAKDSFRESWKSVTVLIMVLFYAAGTKAYIAHLLPGVLLLGVGMLVTPGNWRNLSDLLKAIWHGLGRTAPGIRLMVITFVTAAAFLGFFWYVRNWILMGNPFFPYSVQVGQREVVGSDIGGFKFGLQNFFETFRLFLERFGDKLYRIRPDLPYTTGWGWVSYAMGIPAAIWCLFRKRAYRVMAAGFLLSFLLLLFSSPDSPWNMRYFIWFPAILAIAIGLVYEHLKAEPMRAVNIIKLLFSTLTALNLIMVVTYNSFRLQEIQEMLQLPVQERGSAMFTAAIPEAYQEFIKFVPKDSLLGYNVTGNGFVYPLYRADYSQRIVFVPIAVDGSCDDVIQAMRARETRYLQTAPVHTSDRVRDLLFQCSQGDSALKEQGVDLYVIGK